MFSVWKNKLAVEDVVQTGSHKGQQVHVVYTSDHLTPFKFHPAMHTNPKAKFMDGITNMVGM